MVLDGLLGRGFAPKCKSLIKLIKTRLELIKRKRNAMLKYLKKDMADLLCNGLDYNAYGRAEGLIVEINHSKCYDLIEQFCGCILEQLSSMQKTRECPPESREAASSLMVAAARFADLPELRDLRRIFTEKYGNTLEASGNREFLERLESKLPSTDQKLQLMRAIAQEFSINWDSKALRDRLSSPSTPTWDQPKTCLSLRDSNNATITTKQEISPREIPHPAPFPEYMPKQEAKRESKSIHDARVTPKHEISSQGRPEPTPYPGYRARREVKTDNKAISRKDDFPPSEFNIAGIREVAENVERRSFNNKAPPYHLKNNIAPPYVKPRDRTYSNNSEESRADPYHNEPSAPPMNSSVSDHIGHERQGRGQTRTNGYEDEKDHRLDNSINEVKPKPRSVRRKHLKPPPGQQNPTTEDNVVSVSRIPIDRRSHDGRRSIPIAADNHGIDEEEKYMDRLLMHYSKKPNFDNSKMGRGLKALIQHQAEADTDESPTSRKKDEVRRKPESGVPPSRAISLPPEPTDTEEVPRVPTRATSFQPDGYGGHVHPKLPDYDDLAARIQALRGVLK